MRISVGPEGDFNWRVKHYFIEQIDREYYIYMEDMRDGNLAQKIKEQGKLRLNTVKLYTLQILKGLEYLHCVKGIIHLDIKPANILISSSGKIKLSDFGEAKFIEESTGTIKGTIAYMAPEIVNVKNLFLANVKQKKKKYDYSADIWSVGCVVFEMLTGKTLKSDSTENFS